MAFVGLGVPNLGVNRQREAHRGVDILLVFAYHFPPENTSGAARPFRFCKYLRRLGYRCHVITAADHAPAFDSDADYIPDPFSAFPRTGIGWQLERLVRRFLLPAVVGTRWAFHAYRAAKRFVRNQPGARIIVLSTSPPLGNHLAAYALSRLLHLPWMVDFRDPLAYSPVDDDLPYVSRIIYRKLEKIFIASSDRIIANTDSAREQLMKRYSAQANRIELIWNGFDPEQRLDPSPAPPSQRRTLSHVGELYAGRDVTPILYAIRRLIDSGQLQPDCFRIQLVGPQESSAVPDASFIGNARKQGWLNIIPERIPQAAAQEITQASDGLLLIQPQSVVQVPAKLFEYLQIGRPILAYIAKNSPVQRILESSGVFHECLYPESTCEEIDSLIYRFIRSLGVAPVGPNEWFEREFSAESHAGKLSELIQECLDHRPH